ncbi:uncharacterized protein LOC141588111 [Silene latifolia]|uniref:uncharacterized protein LOC141588111 n=1 Tax=Silene latifolia TaxID=37657 RepID=UPI003D783C57
MGEGTLTFKYLGVPIKTKRLNAKDCRPLIDKIVQRIRNLGARKLSYAGRLVLIQSVLNTLYNYWASMFILPQGFIHRIEGICRNFLWDGGVDYMRNPLVSWDKICKPKNEGDLGLKNDSLWNQAAVGKLVWWIALKSDHLWVKWVNQVYIKGKDWLDYHPTSNSSWSSRKICQTKEMFLNSYQQQIWTSDKGYTIARGYEMIRLRGDKISWSALIWNKLTIPKHGFLAWIYHHNILNTNEKLHNLGISETDTCCICGMATESSKHLFFECVYSRRVLQHLKRMIGTIFPHTDSITWRLNLKGSDLWTNGINAFYNASIHYIWRQRNQSKHELTILHPQKLATLICKEMKMHILSYPLIMMGNQDRSLMDRLKQLQV